jgi:hypothetical protein
MGVTVGLRPGELLIDDDGLDADLVFRPRINGEVKGRGYDPTQVSQGVKNTFGDPPSNLQLIPENEWQARLEQLAAEGALLSHLRNRGNNGQPIPSLDQNGQGFCWAYSIGGVITINRARANMPYKRMSPHAVACKIKNFQDEGGWCGLSALFARTTGYPTVDVWPEKSMSRGNDKPEVWANAGLHKVTEEWVDLSRDVWDQNLTFAQVATCLLSGSCCAVDFNWWGHSVCALDLVLVEAGSWGLRILNSWTDGWGENGTAVLRGSKALPNGAICVRTTHPSLASAPCQGPQLVTPC